MSYVHSDCELSSFVNGSSRCNPRFNFLSHLLACTECARTQRFPELIGGDVDLALPIHHMHDLGDVRYPSRRRANGSGVDYVTKTAASLGH
jgi:hypothetical protein